MLRSALSVAHPVQPRYDREMRKLLLLPAAIIVFLLNSISQAQDAAPAEMLSRTAAIRLMRPDGSAEQGTAFAIAHNGKLYEITARHVVKGVSEQNPTNVQIRQGSEWRMLPIKRVIYPSSADVDIAILETSTPPTQPFSVETMSEADKATVVFGQPVWFLGYPFLEGLGSKPRGSADTIMPFIKKGIYSAIDASNSDAVVLYIDGLNNPGFSGGPVVYYDFGLRRYLILGVVMGFRNDTAEAIVNGKRVETSILVNSGILIAYDIKHAIVAIDKASSTK